MVQVVANLGQQFTEGAKELDLFSLRAILPIPLGTECQCSLGKRLDLWVLLHVDLLKSHAERSLSVWLLNWGSIGGTRVFQHDAGKRNLLL